MNEESEVELAAAGVVGAAFDCGAETSFVLTEAAFELPSLAVGGSREVSGQQPSIGSGGRAFTGSASGRRDDALGAERLTNELVVGLGVEAGVGDELGERGEGERVLDHGRELRVVGPGALRGGGRDVEVALGVTKGRDLGEMALLDAGPPAVVVTGVTVLVAGTVDGHQLDRVPQHLQPPGLVEGGLKEPSEAPFFRRRFSA